MNQGFSAYYGGGLKAAATTLYKNKNLLKYYAYLMMNLLARVTILPAVLFDLIAVRQARQVYDDKRLQLCTSFRAAEKGKTLGTMLLVRVMQVLMLLAGIAIAAIVGGVVGLLGSFVAWKAGVAHSTGRLFFYIPIAALSALTAIVLLLFFAPSAYIVEQNEGFGMAGVLEVSFDTMRKRGAFTHFMHHFVSLLVHGAFVGGIFVLYRISAAKQGGAAVALLIGAVVLGIAYLLLGPLFTLAPRVADYCLMEDISLDPSNRAKHAKRIMISRSSKGDRDYGHDKKLLALFDADDAPIADTQVHENMEEASEAFESFSRAEKEAPAPKAPPVAESVVERADEEPVEATTEERVEVTEEAPTEAVEPTPKKAKGKRKAEKTEQTAQDAGEQANDTGDDL